MNILSLLIGIGSGIFDLVWGEIRSDSLSPRDSSPTVYLLLLSAIILVGLLAWG